MTDEKPIAKPPVTNSTAKDKLQAGKVPAATIDSKSTKKTSPGNASVANKTTNTNGQNKVSKIAVFTLLLVIIIIAAMASAVVFYQRQHLVLQQQLQDQIASSVQQQSIEIKQQFDQQLGNYQQTTTDSITAQLNDATQSNLSAMSILEQRVNQQITAKPTDWLLNEAEYLIRMASRSLWLHQDSQAAIKLLIAADAQFKQKTQTKYLVLRQLIQEDIAQLRAIPALTTEDAVLSLLALTKQVMSLPLAHGKKEQIVAVTPELSSDIADWRSNLLITWNKFKQDYFTLRPINANIQPLLAPEYQQHLRQNLALKIQLAIWAATEHKSSLFKQALTDISQWLTAYFDMAETANIAFNTKINELHAQIINIDGPIELRSLLALQQEINQQLLDNTETKLPLNKPSADDDNDAVEQPLPTADDRSVKKTKAKDNA